MRRLLSCTAILIAGSLLGASQVQAASAPAATSPSAGKTGFEVYISQGEELKQRNAAIRTGKPIPLGRRADALTMRQAADRMLSRPVPTAEVAHKITANRSEHGVTYAMTDPIKNPITLQECATNEYAGQAFGYIKHHFAWCERWGFDLIRTVNGIPVGKLSGEVILILAGANGIDARVRYDWRFTALRAEGVFQTNPDGYVLQNRLYAVPNKTGWPSACGEDRWVGRSATLDYWYPNPASNWYTYGAANGTGLEEKSSCLFIPYFRVYALSDPEDDQKDISPWRDGRYQNGNQIRCDHANYISYGAKREHGCMFDAARGTIYFSWSNTQHYDATQHLWLAWKYPESKTAPSFPGKTIPGFRFKADGTTPTTELLTRNWWDSAMKQRAKTRVTAVCKAIWPNYAAEGKQCDEVPFNSTYQSAGSGTNRFSARAIPAGHNQSGGAWISLYYFYDRILDHDPFRVWFLP